jgi:hypothetical protein
MSKILPTLLLVYLAASLIHFIHNAEFLADYPNLPTSWTRFGVYSAWIVMTIIGVGGWIMKSRRYQLAGLLLLAMYAALGLDSLAHYVVAPLSNHTAVMNLTMLLEVTAAALVFIEVVRQIVQQVQSKNDIV